MELLLTKIVALVAISIFFAGAMVMARKYYKLKDELDELKKGKK